MVNESFESKIGEITKAELGQDFTFPLPQIYRLAIHKAAEKMELEPVDTLALFCHWAMWRLQKQAESTSFVHLAETISQRIHLAAQLIDPDPTNEDLVECFFIEDTDWLKSFQIAATHDHSEHFELRRPVTVVDMVRWFVIATMAKLHTGRMNELAEKVIRIIVTKPNSPPDNLL